MVYRPGSRETHIEAGGGARTIIEDRGRSSAIESFIQKDGFNELTSFDRIIETLESWRQSGFEFTTNEGKKIDVSDLIQRVSSLRDYKSQFNPSTFTSKGGLRSALEGLVGQHMSKKDRFTGAEVKGKEFSTDRILSTMDALSQQKFSDADSARGAFEGLQRLVQKHNEILPEAKQFLIDDVFKEITINIVVPRQEIKVHLLKNKIGADSRWYLAINDPKFSTYNVK